MSFGRILPFLLLVACSANKPEETPATPIADATSEVAADADVTVPDAIAEVAADADETAADAAPEIGPGETRVVEVGRNGLSFEPANLVIKQGDTVRWNFRSGGHNVVETIDEGCTTKPSGFMSGADENAKQVLGTNWERRFDAKGKFFYKCTPHCGPGFGMKGTITVE
jgi:plastocyanin